MGEPKQDIVENNRQEDTYYDILKVSRTATISEIVAAYHTAKNTFSRESIATYSLFEPGEIDSILEKLDEAYHTLSNIEKKREYDRLLEMGAETGNSSIMTELELKQRAARKTKTPDPKEELEPEIEYTPLPSHYEGCISGTVLKEIRERRGITVQEVAQTTKMPNWEILPSIPLRSSAVTWQQWGPDLRKTK